MQVNKGTRLETYERKGMTKKLLLGIILVVLCLMSLNFFMEEFITKCFIGFGVIM